MCQKLLFISFVSLLVFASSALAAPLISDADLVMYYDFASVGATVADGSGQGNDATVVGSVTGYSFGRSGADVVFGGDDEGGDILDVVATALADRPSSAITIAAWCKVDDTNQDMSVFNAFGPKPSDPGSNAYLYHMEVRTGSDRYRWCVRNEEGETIGSYYYDPVDGVITDEWFHFACTYDSAAPAATAMKMYINGELVMEEAGDAGLTDRLIGTNWDNGAAIGATADGARPYQGQMDEFYMFKRALTPAEISTLASASWLVNGGFETGDLTGWFTWDEGTAGTYEVIAAPNSIGQGDYSAQITAGQQCGIAQEVAIPAGTVVQIDALWTGNCTNSFYWAEVKVLTHAPGSDYNLSETLGDFKYVAKTDAWGLNPKTDGDWDWENGAEGSPKDGNTIISQGEIVVTTKIGGTNGDTMAVDNFAVTPLYSIVKATEPTPPNAGSITVVEFDEVALSWEPGSLAGSHDIYFGSDFDDVNDATTASAEFMGNQAAASYSPTIAAEGVYYWRVDEVNDTDVWKGDVWSFEVGLVPPPKIDDPVLWYKFDETSDTNVADSSGNGYDSVTNATPIWDSEGAVDGCLSNDTVWRKQWIIVPPEAFATLDQQATITWWTQRTPDLTGAAGPGGWFSGKNSSGTNVAQAKAYASGDDWYVPYNMGAASNDWWWGYGSNTADDEWHHFALVFDGLGGVEPLYWDGVRVTNPATEAGDSMADIDAFNIFTRTTSATGGEWWDSFHGKLDDFRVYDRALSAGDIQLFVGDRFKVAARPYPADGAENVALEALTAEWGSGTTAVSHQIYFGDDRIEVKNADTSSACYMGEQTENTAPGGPFELMKTYYWRVDEVDDEGTVWKGDVWSFSTVPSIIVEDFESYDNEGNDVTVTWTDADTSGAGDMQRFLATDPGYPALSLVNSLRLRYRLTAWGDFAYLAKTSRSFSPAQDWTEGGVKILSVNYYGDAGNFGLPMFVTVGDGTTEASVSVDANTLDESWNEVNVSLDEVAAAGVDLTNVTYMEIGFGDGTNQGSSSSQYDMVYIDDIALFPPKCVLSESTLQGDITQDCVVNYDDLEEVAFNWLLAGYTVSAEAVSDDDLVLHYEFENNTVDSVAGNNGTLQNLGSAATYETGHDGGKCIHFNATASDSGSNMIVPPAAFADVNEEVTFSFWLKNDTDAPAWYQNTFGGTDEAGQRNHLFMHYSPAYMSNMVSVFHAGSGGSEGWSQWDAVSFTQPESFDYTAWNHIALVKNCFNGQMWMYTNGQLSAYERGEVNKMYGCDKFRIGSLYSDAACYQGCFDDFRVYNRALSHAEILTLAGQTSATVAVSELGAEDSDVNDDDAVDFKDYSVLAGEWLVEDLWP